MFSDMKVLVKDPYGSQEIILLHKVIIYHRAPLLYMHILNEGILSGFTIESVRIFLQYLYCDSLEFPSAVNPKTSLLEEINKLANQFQIRRLTEIVHYVKELGIKYLENICECVESNLQYDMLQALNDKDSMDLEFIIGEQVIYAHALIVCARCPYFNALLTRWSNCRRVEIKDVRPEIWITLLKYLYTSIVNVNHQNAIELAVAASHYLVSDLKDQPQEIIKQCISYENVVEILHVADSFMLEEVIKSCLKFLQSEKHFTQSLIKTEKFKRLDRKLRLLIHTEVNGIE